MIQLQRHQILHSDDWKQTAHSKTQKNIKILHNVNWITPVLAYEHTKLSDMVGENWVHTGRK